MEKNMKCPYCFSDLIVSGQECYETLIDHVCNPNLREYPLRSIYTCSNNCEKSDNRFWDFFGDVYSMGARNWKSGYKRAIV